jgi:hypothetical protein
MSQLEPESFDPQHRRLCPDGACVGVIGADGRCRMCGTPDAEGAALPGLSAAAFQGGGASEQDDDRDDERQALTDERGLTSEDGQPGFDPQRALCPDGACVGVLGPDRRCKVCGQLAER